MSEFIKLLNDYPMTHFDLLEKDSFKRQNRINNNKLSHLVTNGIGCSLRALKSPKKLHKLNLSHIPIGIKVKRGNEIFTMNSNGQLTRKLK